MSLIGSLNLAKSALAAHQAAIQVTSNNIANAGNTDYTRQVMRVLPRSEQQIRPGVFLGTGVNIAAVERQIDDALEQRLRASISDNQSADVRQQFLARVESVFNELGDADISSKFSAFFNAWSNLANRPQDLGLRQVVIQAGDDLAGTLRDTQTQLSGVRTDLGKRVEALTLDANGLAQQVADLNGQIAAAEGGAGGTANLLRDQRDAVLKQLSEIVNIKTQDLGNGIVNVTVGSTPLVLGTTNRGLRYAQDTENGQIVPKVIVKEDNSPLSASSGMMGGLMKLNAEIPAVAGQIDDLAANLIFELNKIHSAGQGLDGFSTATAANAVIDADVALNSPDAGLDFAAGNGSFVVHVKQKSTGLIGSSLIQVRLDGLGSGDTTLTSLRDSLDEVAGISASIVNGKLKIDSESPGIEFGFSQDSSGALAALGINSFFTGSSAADIAVSADLKARPSLLAAAKNGQLGDNQTAIAIAALSNQSVKGLQNRSLTESYEAIVNGVAVSASAARTGSEASIAVLETLNIQREALSGVSLDEEAVNLMKQQRAFQGSARIISAVDEMMQTLLNMV